VFAREAANVIKIKFKKSSLELYAESKTTGNQKTLVDAKVEGEIGDTKEIAFNYRFLEELIGVIEGESLGMSFTGTNAPGVFKDPEDHDYLHLIMPVKIEA
jgi:DNA polymerase-3 subunit beta